MKAIAGISVIAFGVIGVWAASQGTNSYRVHQLKSLKVAKVSVAGHPFDLWIMDNEPKRSEGMMFLTDKEVKANQGMIFLFPSVQPGDRSHGFWMSNTLIPLDIIYIDSGKRVINIANGKIRDETTLPPKGPYQYVIELKAGTAKKMGIKPGSRFQIPPDLKSAD